MRGTFPKKFAHVLPKGTILRISFIDLIDGTMPTKDYVVTEDKILSKTNFSSFIVHQTYIKKRLGRSEAKTP